MRTLASMAASLLLFGASPALAQGLGLDLSGDAPENSTETEAAQAPAQPPPASAEELARQQAGRPDDGVERAVTQDDRVKAVQRKHFLKRNRLEVVPSFAISLNDAFYSKVGGGIAANWHFADSLALSLHYEKFGIAQTDNVRIAKRELKSLLLSSKLDWTAGADMVWTPIYGKLAWGNTIVAYDLFLLSGVGVAWSQTSGSPVDDGAHPAVDIGIGQRFAMFDFMAFEFWVKQLLYADRPQDRQISEIQKVLTLNVGLSFWLPGSFTYENP
ncbi:outer membrane beta-barrel domain-containing protein [Vulgatibacter sp.]|uniref:outer membrane beta-barrel domain-containing protein n=1 Tax=Vulgatibacter sp. TaxID=1971226 RepID=UPI003562B8B9